MGSTEPASASTTTTITAISSSTSTSAQVSPFTNFLNNLSPIKAVHSPDALEGFLGLNSPQHVFTSPQINALRETSSCKTPACHQLPLAELSQNDDGAKKSTANPNNEKKSFSPSRDVLITKSQKDKNVGSSVQVQPSSSSVCVDEFLADPVDIHCATYGYGVKTGLKQSSDVLQSSGRPPCVHTINQLFQRELTCNITKSVGNEDNKTCGIWLSNEYPKIESNSCCASEEQQSEKSRDKNAGSPPGNESDCPLQLLPESFPTLQTDEGFHENSGAVVQGPHESALNDPEVSKHQRGMSRRCLQFGEAQAKVNFNSSNPSNKANDVTISLELDSMDPYQLDLNATSDKRNLANLPQPLTSMFPRCYTGKPPLTVSKPLVIGLHLNSVVKTSPEDHGVLVGGELASTAHGMHEPKAYLAASSLMSDSFDDVRPSSWLPPVEPIATPLTKRKFRSEHTDNYEDTNQQSPKGKRKKSSSNVDSDGCKRCNCKKTRCLKLYCDCFAAGIYCAESCACQECFNRPEFEDTVLETRQQIESRNPLAFAPKIIQRVTEFTDDGNQFTPSSARHKRGCNCKKSMCLKKYCECYQATVGCSSGCRCESCKNVYGRKEEYVGNVEMINVRSRFEDTPISTLEMDINKNHFLQGELYDHNLTPPTPSFFSDRGKDVSEPQIISRRYSPTPQSALASLSSDAKSSRSLNGSNNKEILMATTKENVDIDSYGQGRDHNSVDMVDQFSSRCYSLANKSDFPPMLDFPSTAAASSKETGWTKVSRLQLCPRSGNLSSGGSLHWRSSPLTPLTQQGGTKSLQALDSDSRLGGIQEDGTPGVLKAASTPIKSVKVSSPSRHKRVSPPQGRVNKQGSHSSGTKALHKIILKALPSFPPLSPCMDSKGSTNQKSSPPFYPCTDSKGSTDQARSNFHENQ